MSSPALETFLAGHESAAAPALVVSALLFAGCAGLLAFVRRLDRTR